MKDPEWPKTAVAVGGKYAYNDDQETPNTLYASFDFGGRELQFEVRGILTGGEGYPAPRRAGGAATAPAANTPASAPPVNVMVGDLFYGTEGWMSMADQGVQAYKGESSELIYQERPERGQGGGDPTQAHMTNFLDACKSRNYKDLHDELGNAFLSASLCHLANISYRTGRKLTLESGPKFAGDAEATKMLTRPAYRKGYVV
jgi:hypothetical protein